MNKHPTPIQIKCEIYKAIVAKAVGENIPPHTIIRIFDAVDIGVKTANEKHDELLEALGGTKNG